MISLYIIGTGCILASIFLPPKAEKFRRLLSFSFMAGAICAVLPWHQVRIGGLILFLLATLTLSIYTLLRNDKSIKDKILVSLLTGSVLAHFLFKTFAWPGAEIVQFGLIIGLLVFLYMGFNIKKYIQDFAPVAVLYSVSLFELMSGWL